MNPSILITGVGKRLGFAMAEHFVQRDYHVIGTYRTKREGLSVLAELGVELHQCDLLEQKQLDELVNHLTGAQRSLRAIIHNASDWSAEKDSSDLCASFDAMMGVHAKAPYYLNLQLEHLLCDGSDIIHISDYVASTGSSKHIAYAASKAAIENLTLSFAKKLAPTTTVNAIAPALVLFNEGDSEDYKAKALAKSLMAREGGLDEFLAAVDYLMSSQYITGRTLPFDGGRHIK